MSLTSTKHPNSVIALSSISPLLDTKRDISRKAQVSLRTIDLWVRNKRIPSIKLGRAIRFRWKDVENALLKYQRNAI